MISPWLVLSVLLGGSLAREFKSYDDCALQLSPKGFRSRGGRSSCIRFDDVNEAFAQARQKVGLRYPAREVNDQTIAHLGTALQETTRILAARFWLSRREVETVLPRLDTSLTEIWRFCAATDRIGGGSEETCREERYRRHDGTCNNLARPAAGAATYPFARLLHPQYSDRISEPRVGREGFPLPPPRLVSTTVHSDKATKHEHAITIMFPAWGQLIDHDLTLTAETKDPETRRDIDCCAGGGSRHPNCMPIGIPDDDNFYSPLKQRCMNFARSLAGVRPGCRLGSRVQMNLLTSHIDANFIYGSNFRTADSLRTLQGGQLKTEPVFDDIGLKPLLPPKIKQPDDGCIRSKPNLYCFLAGDNRVNEQLALGVLHTLVVREHNRIATELGKINPYWDDETLYQETRHIMAAIVQHITYREYLPRLLGDQIIDKYELRLKSQGYANSYDPSVDDTIPAAFGTAAYRFGHSLLPTAMETRSATHKLIGETKLRTMLQQPYDLYKPGYVDAYTLGMVGQLAQAMDSSITSEVTNHLFQEPINNFGRDLASINIARAREHGVPGYMAYRKLCELDDMTSWEDMWNHLPNDTIKHYLHLYSHPDDVDLWSAGVSELPAPGSMLGPVFSCIIAMTFRNLKKGDRFWYENKGFRNSFTLGQLNQIRKYSLSRLICNAGDNIQTIQVRALLMSNYESNPRVSCKSGQIPDIDLTYWRDTNYVDEKVTNTYTPATHVKPTQPTTEKTDYPYPEHEHNIRPINQYPDSIFITDVPPQVTPIDAFTARPANLPEKPPGFDQIIYNLFNDHKNKSHLIVQLTDSYGINGHNHIDSPYVDKKSVKL